MFHDSALESTIRDLIRDFQNDKISVLTELIHFILSCSGCKQGQVDSETVQNVDSISNTLVGLTQTYDPVSFFLYFHVFLIQNELGCTRWISTLT